MSINDTLDALRADNPGCETVVYGDLGARMVLCVSATHQQPQEVHDATIAKAAQILDGPIATGAASLLAGHAADGVVIHSAAGVDVFLRTLSDEPELLCCRAAPDGDIAGLLNAARVCLDALGAEG